MKDGTKTVLSILLALFLLPGALPAQPGRKPVSGQTPAPAQSDGQEKPSPGPDLSPQALERKLEEAKSIEGLTEEGRKQTLDYLQKALAAARTAEETASRLAALKQQLEEAPGKIEELRAKLEELRKSDAPARARETSAGIVAGELPDRLKEAKQAAAAAEKVLAGIDAEDEALPSSDELRQQIERSEKNLGQIKQDLEARPEEGTAPPLLEARRLLLLARQEREKEELGLAKASLEGDTTRRQLLKARREIATLELTARQALVQVLNERQVRRQQEEAKQAREKAEAAQAEAARLPRPVQELAGENVELGRQGEELARKKGLLAEKLEAAKARLADIKVSFKRQQERLELGGLTPALSLSLRKERKGLVDLKDFRRNAAARRTELGRVANRQIELEEKRLALDDLEKNITEVVAKQAAQLPAAARETLRAGVEDHVKLHKELIGNLENTYREYQDALTELEIQELKLARPGREYALFIDRNLLWSRSTDPILLDYPGRLAAALADLAAPARWSQAGEELLASLAADPLLWGVSLLAALVLLFLRPFLRRRLARLAEQVRSVRTDSVVYSLEGAGCSLLIALGWPLFPLLAGLILGGRVQAGPCTQGLAGALWATGLVGLGFALLRVLLLAKGLGDAHFRWPQPARKALLANLRWLRVLLLPLFFVIAFTEGAGVETWQIGPGRLACLAALALAGIFSWRVLAPWGPVVSAFGARSGGGFLYRSRHLWFFLVTVLFAALVVMACLGYYYTAINLGRQVLATAFFFVGLILVHELILRWLLVTQRRLAYAQALEKREKARQEQEEAGGEESQKDEEVKEPEIDHRALKDQSRSLLNVAVAFTFLVGLYTIWSPVLPALQVFNEVKMWSYTAKVDGVEKSMPITLGNCLLALVIFIVTWVSARNVPAVLEMALLSRLKVETGVRYAYSTMVRYVIFALGIFMAFGAIGIGWSQVQFLVAALGVGLGFGLQEIFANFVSGLILLFERPIRVGDVVTVGDISGQVMKIRIRATTITDWDRKELIVPNKSFITGQLVNWSLSDQITRVTIPVGIAYGSDTARAEEIMLRLVKENPLVMEEPHPNVLFLGFGDNTLNFSIRVFTKKVGNRLALTHQLHHRIDQEFRKAGIEIAFPQRDVHLKVPGPLEIRLHGEKENRERE